MSERVRMTDPVNLEDLIISSGNVEADDQVEFISTGSTLLNLASSGKGIFGGWARNRVVNIVGDGSSGKTLLVLEAISSAMNRMIDSNSRLFPAVKKIVVRYNNPETVMDFDIRKIWGIDRENIDWVSSRTIQEFGRDFGQIADNISAGDMVIYVLDSLDALPSEEEVERFEKSQKKNESVEGSFNMEKQSYLGKFFRSEILPKMDGKDITLFIISQVRSKIGVTFGEKLYRTGGKALDFYTHQVMWLNEKEKLKKFVKGHDIVNGIRVRARLKRSKVSKPFRECEFTVLFDYGIDNIGSNIDYLFDLGGKKTGNNLIWDKNNFKSRSGLISYIEENNQEYDLEREVEKKWFEIEEEASGAKGRKKRF
jgi:recombination protein RecA